MLNYLLSVIRRSLSDPDLLKKERELEILKIRLRELHTWCAGEFPEVGCAAKWALNMHDAPHTSGAFGSVDCFREALRKGLCGREFSIQQPKQGYR